MLPAAARTTVHRRDAGRRSSPFTRRTLSLHRGYLSQKTDTKSSDKSQNYFLHWIEPVYGLVSRLRLMQNADRSRDWCKIRIRAFSNHHRGAGNSLRSTMIESMRNASLNFQARQFKLLAAIAMSTIRSRSRPLCFLLCNSLLSTIAIQAVLAGLDLIYQL